MVIIEQQQNCENCRYFCQHYYRSKSGKFHKVFGDGHCANDKLTKSVSRKIISKCLNCEFWQPTETQDTEQRENAYKAVLDMQIRLEEIALLLKDDNL